VISDRKGLSDSGQGRGTQVIMRTQITIRGIDKNNNIISLSKSFVVTRFKKKGY
jgi:hypothetical protein